MYPNTNQLERNRQLRDNFLDIREIPQMYRAQIPTDPNERSPWGYIYCIENKLTHKKYIGSAYSTWVGVKSHTIYHTLSKRATMYIYEYNKALKNSTTKANETLRPIIRALVEEGIENFVMYPIAETNKDTHVQAELFFIDKYKTCESGYNVNNTGYENYKFTLKGRPQSTSEKIKKSEPIICVNMNTKEIIRSDSMKLFADFLNTSKDQAKNRNRAGMPLKGWFIFYINSEKRESILVNNVINDQDKRQQERHSEKAKAFYTQLYNSVSSYLKDYTREREYFPGFKVLPELKYTV